MSPNVYANFPAFYCAGGSVRGQHRHATSSSHSLPADPGEEAGLSGGIQENISTDHTHFCGQ